MVVYLTNNFNFGYISPLFSILSEKPEDHEPDSAMPYLLWSHFHQGKMVINHYQIRTAAFHTHWRKWLHKMEGSAETGLLSSIWQGLNVSLLFLMAHKPVWYLLAVYLRWCQISPGNKQGFLVHLNFICWLSLQQQNENSGDSLLLLSLPVSEIA